MREENGFVYLNSCNLEFNLPFYRRSNFFAGLAALLPLFYAGLEVLCPLLRLVIVKSMFCSHLSKQTQTFQAQIFVVAHELMDVFYFPARLLFAPAAALALFCRFTRRKRDQKSLC